MDIIDFNKIVDQRVEKIKATLITKAKEYANDLDRLHNFNRGAQISGQIREKVLNGFMLKHQISLLDILDNMEKGINPTREVIDEKIGDIINYLILLEASIINKIDK